MCGRFVLATPVAEIGRIFGVAERPNLEPRWNIAPTQMVATIRYAPEAEVEAKAGEGAAPRQLVPMRWGLVPFWAKDAAIGSKMINARADTLAEKPAFREAFRRRRVLIPADGFYEWQAVGSRKQPYYIHPAAGGPLAFAGLWESWRGPKGEAPLPEPMVSCTIVTTDSNRALSFLHDRMPVILDPADWAAWLDPATPVPALSALLRPAPEGLLQTTRVAPLVNAVRNEGPELVRPLAEEPRLL